MPVGTLAVRVVPRSSRRAVRVEEAGVVVHVRSAPEGGRATEEARRLLAEALGVPRSVVRLRTGVRARNKIFEIEGMDASAALERIEAG